jgi:SOS response associated peptidase (SRAP)
MCGRVTQSSSPLRLAIVEGLDVSHNRMGNVRPRYNAAPSQELLVIRENHKNGERSLDLIKWGLVPHSCTDPRGGRRPIKSRAALDYQYGAVAVMLDFMNPVSAFGRLVNRGSKLGRDKAKTGKAGHALF